MKLLNFGCRRSDYIISPANYREIKTDDGKKEWFVMCRFYEPNAAKPFIFKKKIFKNLSLREKKDFVKIHQDIMENLLLRDYNPRTQSYMFTKEGIHQDLYFLDALDMVLESRPVSDEYRNSVQSYLRKVRKSSKSLKLDYLKIKDVELPHVKKILQDCAVSNCDFNKMKKGISPLFADLVDEGCLKVNPCTGIKAKPHVTAIKKVFTDEEFNSVFNHIKTSRPNFVNYMMCFCMSGSRTPEILGVQKKDVDLAKREFTITLKKGNQHKRVQRVIYPEALPFWTAQMNLCQSAEDYLFGAKFLPNTAVKRRDSVYNFWKVNVMEALNTDITIYSLKYYFLDKLDDANYKAGKAAGHRNREITDLYTIGKKKREIEYLKTIEIRILNDIASMN